ncbi:MAG: protein-tyrosine phosphatase [Gaiellaceae bacterium]|nr:protein-tyrosine phosphatase [Gaiellaceae bacterium]
MIDLHSHVLPGLDDGAADLDEAVAICRAAAADGTRVLAATPHVRDDYPTTPEQMERALAAVRAAAGDGVRLVGGGEIDLAWLERPREELARFALAGNPKYLLVETPYRGWPLDLPEKLFRLQAVGITPVLAHPERNAEVQQRPELLEPVVAAGTLVQLTAASVDGRTGRRARACAATLLERNLAHLLASDAHAPGVRAIGMSAAAATLGDEALAHWLTVEVPGAIVENEPLPPRPRAVQQRRRFLRRS